MVVINSNYGAVEKKREGIKGNGNAINDIYSESKISIAGDKFSGRKVLSKRKWLAREGNSLHRFVLENNRSK